MGVRGSLAKFATWPITRIANSAFRLYVEQDRTSIGDMDPLFKYSPAALNLIDLGLYSHTDGETLALLPWPGLQDVTRAFAKIITLSNQMDIQSLRGPEREPQPSAE